MLLQPPYKNILGDHFSLLPILVSPFYWITGSYTMLLFQIASILFGGFGIYQYFRNKNFSEPFSLLAMIHFFSIWGIYSALAFDYHDNVVAAMLVPWFILFFEKANWKKATIFFILICISKENIAIWAVFISLGLCLLHLNERKKIKAALLYLVFAATYAFVIIKFVMPGLTNDQFSYHHFNFDALGNNFKDALVTVFTKPAYTFSLLFENHLEDSSSFGIKSELHFMILASGGIALIFKPQYLVMLLPIYAQKLFNNSFEIWGLNSHYSIEFVPVLTIALFNWLSNLQERKRIKAGLACLLITITATASSLDYRVSKWYFTERHRFYQKSHYIPEYNTSEVYEGLKLIPEKASVSASSSLVPHLAFRDYIYQFPVINNAEYIALLEDDKYYPIGKNEFLNKVNEMKKSSHFQTVFSKDKIIIFKIVQ